MTKEIHKAHLHIRNKAQRLTAILAENQGPWRQTLDCFIVE